MMLTIECSREDYIAYKIKLDKVTSIIYTSGPFQRSLTFSGNVVVPTSQIYAAQYEDKKSGLNLVWKCRDDKERQKFIEWLLDFFENGG